MNYINNTLKKISYIKPSKPSTPVFLPGLDMDFKVCKISRDRYTRDSKTGRICVTIKIHKFKKYGNIRKMSKRRYVWKER